LNSFTIFWECSSIGRVETALKTKKFSSLFQPVQAGLAKNEARMTFFSFLNFFTVFLGMLKPWLGRNGARNEIFFFNLFFGWSRLGLARNKARIMFF